MPKPQPYRPFPKMADEQALQTIIQEFGGVNAPEGNDAESIKERNRRLIVIRDFIAAQPKIHTKEGLEYSCPYSYGLHLAALRADRDKWKWPPDAQAEVIE